MKYQQRNIKKYLENIYNLEVSLYKQNELYNSIACEVEELEGYDGEMLYPSKSKYSFMYYDIFEDIDFCIEFMLGSAFLGAIICGVIGYLLTLLFHFDWRAIIYGIITGAILGLILPPVVTLIQYLFDSHKINLENSEIALKNDELRHISNEKKKLANRRIEILNQELEKISYNYNKTNDVLEKYYDMNIIFPKYRNLIAVSSFYEYFMSGRCSELEGHEGAYNIYENEVRLDRINDKLDDIIEHLESIKQNQYMLYSAIQECNRSTRELTGCVLESAEQLQNIENNTAVTAYNSGIAAQNTEFLKWIKIFDI